MAHVAKLSRYVAGGVAGESIQEGRAVRVLSSGLRGDLRTVMLAASGTKNVFIAMAVPDQFARPTENGMYTAGYTTTMQMTTGYGDPKWSSVTLWRVGKSVTFDPTIGSGELVQLHSKGTYAVPSGNYIDTSTIKVPGNMIKVSDDAAGRWQYTTDTAQAVGFVEEFDGTNGVLIITLY